MRKLNRILKDNLIIPNKYEKKGNIAIIYSNDKKYYIKKNTDRDIFKYLDTRNFNYYPKRINAYYDDYEITEYIKGEELPTDQKMMDMIDLVSLLHNKTTHYKEIDIADYKKIYEDINNNIEYLVSYYNDLITIIESKVYMSPSEYLLARNISKVFSALNYCKKEIDIWYEMVAEKKKHRVVLLHNNLDLSHFIKSDKSYLLSWRKAKIDIPIFDIYKLYRKNGLEVPFDEILKRYEQNYPLTDDERKLLFILIAMPNIIDFDHNEYELTNIISKEIDMLYKSENLISPYYPENGPTEQHKE